MTKIHSTSAFLFFAVLALAAPSFAHAAAMTTTNEDTVPSTYCTGALIKYLSSIDTSQLPSDYNTPGKYCITQTTTVTSDCTGAVLSRTQSYALYSTSNIAWQGTTESSTCSTTGGGGGGGGGQLFYNNIQHLFEPATAFAQTSGQTVDTSLSSIFYLVPTASLSGGTSIQSGGSALLTWSSNLLTSNGIQVGTMTGYNGLNTSGKASGSASVSPTQTTTYTVTAALYGSGTSASANQTVSIVPPLSSSTVSCSASPTSVLAGQTVTWAAQTTGGKGPFNYNFSGDNFGATNSGSVASMTYATTTSYQSSGTKQNQVTITDLSTGSPSACGQPYTYDPYNYCTGAGVSSSRDVEDGGTLDPTIAEGMATELFNAAGNPQNYCATASSRQSCPSSGIGTCYNYYNASLHSGTGITPQTYFGNSEYQEAIISGSVTCTSGTPPTSGTAACSNTVAVNGPPVAPTMTCPANGNVNQNLSFTLNASDPEGDNIRYGYNWTKSGADDFWIPTSGYIPSGTSETVTQKFTSGGTYTLQANAEDSHGQKSPWNTCQVVISTPQPDLTAGGISPTAATAASAQTFTSTVSNIGNASTAAGFYTLFQKANDAAGTGAADLGTYYYPNALSPGNSGTFDAPYSYAFPSADAGTTKYLRACADKSSATDPGLVAELNENNNCGAWTPVSVYAPLAASCSVSPASGYPGDAFTWTASPSGGTGAYTYAWSGSDSLSGTTQSVSKTYANSGAKTGSVSVTSGAQNVNASCSNSVNVKPTPTSLITTSPTTIIDNTSPATLTWTSQNATSCTGTGFWTGSTPSGSVSVNPSTTTTYTLSCTDGVKTVYSSATVTVLQVDLTLTATPAFVRKGDSTTLSWSVAGTPDSCTVAGPGVSANTTSGSKSVVVSGESAYTFSCTKQGLTKSTSTTVKLIPGYQEI